MKKQIAIGIDIGGTNTKIGIFNTEGELLETIIHPTLKDLSAEEFISLLARECEEKLYSSCQLKFIDEHILGVGVGAPMANYFTGYVENAPNLGWKNVALKKIVEEKFRLPAVIENDANLAAMGEKKWGQGKDFQNFILLTLGTGVGTGLILEGKLHRGHKALAGEGGHVIIPHHKERICSCGGMNHLESFLSAQGIKQTIREETDQEWTIERLGVEFKAHHPDALKIMDMISYELATGLASMAVLLGPEAFIIGGGVSKLGDDLNREILKNFNQLVHFSLKDKVTFHTAKLSSDKGAIYGGAALIIEELLK